MDDNAETNPSNEIIERKTEKQRMAACFFFLTAV